MRPAGPPHYLAFRVALAVSLVTAVVVSAWSSWPSLLPLLREFLELP